MEGKSYSRSPPRLRPIYTSDPLYFITICTHRRQRILANKPALSAFVSFARTSEKSNVAVGRFVIMPDHLHFFVRGQPEFSVSVWVGRLKQQLTMVLRGQDEGVEPYWQRGFFDHVLRSSESYAEKWIYVRLNPVRAGLVADTDDWLFQGEIVRIDRA